MLLLGACQNSKHEYKVLNYQASNILAGELLNNSFLFSDPAEIILIDSLLIIHDSQKQDYCFHIFNAYKGDFIKSFGNKGRGPGEVIFPESMNLSHDKKTITTYDPNLKKIVLYNVQNIVNNISPNFSEINIVESPGFVCQALPYKNNFIIRGSDSKMRFGILDSLHKVNPIYTDFPKIVPTEEENWAITSYAPQCALSPDETKMVVTTYIGSVFEIFNLRKNQINIDTIQYYYPPIYNVLKGFKPKWIGTTPESIIGCHNVYATNHFIYTIYEGEAAKKKQIHKKLMLFNWQGEFYKQCSFKEGDPICICVDEINKIFYCILLNEKYEYQLYYYNNIPDSLIFMP